MSEAVKKDDEGYGDASTNMSEDAPGSGEFPAGVRSSAAPSSADGTHHRTNALPLGARPGDPSLPPVRQQQDVAGSHARPVPAQPAPLPDALKNAVPAQTTGQGREGLPRGIQQSVVAPLPGSPVAPEDTIAETATPDHAPLIENHPTFASEDDDRTVADAPASRRGVPRPIQQKRAAPPMPAAPKKKKKTRARKERKTMVGMPGREPPRRLDAHRAAWEKAASKSTSSRQEEQSVDHDISAISLDPPELGAPSFKPPAIPSSAAADAPSEPSSLSVTPPALPPNAAVEAASNRANSAAPPPPIPAPSSQAAQSAIAESNADAVFSEPPTAPPNRPFSDPPLSDQEFLQTHISSGRKTLWVGVSAAAILLCVVGLSAAWWLRSSESDVGAESSEPSVALPSASAPPAAAAANETEETAENEQPTEAASAEQEAADEEATQFAEQEADDLEDTETETADETVAESGSEDDGDEDTSDEEKLSAKKADDPHADARVREVKRTDFGPIPQIIDLEVPAELRRFGFIKRRQLAGMHLRRGVKKQRRRKHGQAQWHFRRAVEFYPLQGASMRHLARYALDDGKLELAANWAHEATNADPRHHLSWMLLGEIQQARGELSGALNAYKKVVSLLPRHKTARQKVSELRVAIKKKKRRAKALRSTKRRAKAGRRRPRRATVKLRRRSKRRR